MSTTDETPMTDGELLNSIGWRLAVALGHTKPGDGQITADLSDLVDEACRRIEESR